MLKFNIVDPDQIWNYRQNKLTYVVSDLKKIYPQIDENIVYGILLKRGIFKWLSIRRRLIKLKDSWTTEVKSLPPGKKTPWERGYLNALEKCRKQVRKLCHSDRLQAPDFDKGANQFLENLIAEEKVSE